MKNTLHIVSLLVAFCLASLSLHAQGAQLTLAWDNNAPTATGNAVERATGLNATTGFVEIARPAMPASTYIDTTLAAGTSYTYRVRAFNAGGYSAYSPTASGTTLPAAPAAPTNTKVTAPAAVVTINMTLGDQYTVKASTNTTRPGSKTINIGPGKQVNFATN